MISAQKRLDWHRPQNRLWNIVLLRLRINSVVVSALWKISPPDRHHVSFGRMSNNQTLFKFVFVSTWHRVFKSKPWKTDDLTGKTREVLSSFRKTSPAAVWISVVSLYYWNMWLIIFFSKSSKADKSKLCLNPVKYAVYTFNKHLRLPAVEVKKHWKQNRLKTRRNIVDDCTVATVWL